MKSGETELLEEVARGEKLHSLVESVIRTTEDELIVRLEKAQEAARGFATAKEFNVDKAKEFFVKEVERQQAELELFVKRLRTLDELRKRSPLERYAVWTGPIGIALALGKILFDVLR